MSRPHAGNDIAGVCLDVDCGADGCTCSAADTAKIMAEEDSGPREGPPPPPAWLGQVSAECLSCVFSAGEDGSRCMTGGGGGGGQCPDETSACTAETECMAIVAASGDEPPDEADCSANALCTALWTCYAGSAPGAGTTAGHAQQVNTTACKRLSRWAAFSLWWRCFRRASTTRTARS